MKKIIIIVLLGIISFGSFCQSPENVTSWIEYLEDLSETETDENVLENLYSDLSYLSQNPFNLNKITKSQLEQLPFLSSSQIENILYYIYKNAPLISIYELKNIEGLDMKTISYLLPFVYLKEEKNKSKFNLKNAIRNGKSELLVRYDYCFQKKAGYQKVSSEEKEKNPGKYYLGEPFYLSAKYSISYNDKYQFGLLMEKDPGEPLWNSHNKGFDHYSFHLVLKDINFIETLIVGDYRLSFGQGLVLNTDFSMGKTADVINITNRNNNIKRHFSSNEIDFFRGVALKLKFNRITCSLFGSHRYLDANSDSSDIFSFKSDGYNRTFKDLEKKQQASVYLGGFNCQWNKDFYGIGITGSYYKFGGKKLNPDLQLYNLFYLRAKDNYNIGIHYNLFRKKYSFQGETAIGRNNKLATINSLQINPASYLGFILSYRHYSIKYQSLYSRAFSESSLVQNEKGIYLGTLIKFLSHYELKFYVDIFKFPWLKYGINSPSDGSDILIQLSFNPSQTFNMDLRYRLKEKGKNFAEDKTQKIVLMNKQHRLKSQISFNPTKEVQIKNQLNIHANENISQKIRIGWADTQTISYNSSKYPFKIDLGFTYFNTPDWEARISVFEKNILYAFSFPNFYGEGIRYYGVVKINILKNLSSYIKFSNTNYFDRRIISSGTEEIDGHIKSDVNCLFRLKF